MKDYCVVCDAPVEVAKHFNPFKDTAVCGRSCKTAEYMFRFCFSDEEINRRQHYREVMMKGGSI